MLRQRVPGLCALLALTAITALLSRVAGEQANTPKPEPLEPVFGKGADGAWKAVSGTYTIANDGVLGKPVLTAGKTPLTLESKMPLLEARELRAWVRLRTDGVPAASADFYLAKKDPRDTDLRLLLTTSQGLDHVSCQVQQGGKPLHDAAALARNLDWPPEPSNGFTYYLRAYGLKDIRPGWPEDFRLRI